jgi:Cu/Ag efflux protein CusF
MKKYLSYLLIAIVLTATLVGFSACTPAELQALQGTLKNVDSVSGNVTVTMKDNSTQTFNFSDVKVDTIKQALGGASLQVGDNVTIKTNKDGDIEEVDSHNAEIEGVIKSIGTDNITITTTRNADITLKVTADTRIKNGDKGTASLSDLKAGQQVDARYAISNNNAISIDVDVRGTVKEAHGTVKAIDTTAKTATITIQQNDITLNITADTIIRIGDKGTASLSDLAGGQKVEVRYDTSNNNALRINLNVGQTVGDAQGTIKSLDTTMKTVTVTTQRQGDIALNITSDTVIRIGGNGTATISDLKAGQKVVVKYDTTTKNALRINIDNGQNDGPHKGQNNNQNNGQNNDKNNGQKNDR